MAVLPAERGVRLGFALAGLVLAADVATKAAIVAWVEYGAVHEWLPILNIVHVLNRGAAFSFLHDAGGWQRYFFIVIAIAASVFLIWMIRRPGTSIMERTSFGLILGGALANMVDRLVREAARPVYLYTLVPEFFRKAGFREAVSLPPDLPPRSIYGCAACDPAACLCLMRPNDIS